jgi:hypothetical protein
MASFNFTSAMLEEGTAFIFGSWVCVADGAGDFCRHLVDNTKPEALAATRCSDLDESIDNLDEMLLPDLARDLKEQSIFNATSTRAAPSFLRSDPIWSKGYHTRFTIGLRNTATVYQEATWFESLSALEEDLDRLLKIGKDEATACREAPIFDDYDSDSDDAALPFMGSHQGLMITSTPQGCFVYWKGKKPSELLRDDARLVAHLDTLPYQEGRPLKFPPSPKEEPR